MELVALVDITVHMNWIDTYSLWKLHRGISSLLKHIVHKDHDDVKNMLPVPPFPNMV